MKRLLVFTGIFLLMSVSAFAAEELLPAMYFSFDEDLGDEVADLSGNVNDGVVFGNGKYVEGKYGLGMSLGAADTVDVKHSETLDITDELTVGIWVNLEGTANQKIIGKSPTLSGWVIGVSGGIYPECWDKNGTNLTTQMGTVPANEWAHLAMTYSVTSEEMILYINGVEITKLNNGGLPIGSTDNMLVIGASPWGKDWPSAGIYDEAKIYNVAFTADQILEMMEEGTGAQAVSPDSKAAGTWGSLKANAE